MLGRRVVSKEQLQTKSGRERQITEESFAPPTAKHIREAIVGAPRVPPIGARGWGAWARMGDGHHREADVAAGLAAESAGVVNPVDGFPPSALRADLRIRPTRLESALDWAQSLAPAPIRVATSCCGMAMVSGGDPFEYLGAGPPAVSARAADLLIVAGSITRRQAPLLTAIYERMLSPRWVIAWGACAISGGAYQNYATIPGLSRLVPVDLVVPGCPPPVTALREALDQLRRGGLRDREPSALTSRDPADWPILRNTHADERMNDHSPLAPENSTDDSVDVPDEEGNRYVDRG